MESGVEVFWVDASEVGQELEYRQLRNFLPLTQGVGEAVSLRCRQGRLVQQLHTCHLAAVQDGQEGQEGREWLMAVL